MNAVDVVVPVYRHVGLTRECLESVLRLSGKALNRLIVINDCSPEPEMAGLLDELRVKDARVRVLTLETNSGFVSAANAGLAIRETHALLLNSDTRVTAGWLEELLGILEEDPRIAAVSPLSNNATLCSVPTWCEAADEDAVTLEAVQANDGPRWTPIPTGHGFCLLLRHESLNLVGLLDPVYGRGYNEENDWCQRVQSLGFIIARANRALVYHRGQVSFGAERDALDAFNAQRLVARYPHYLAQNRDFETGPRAREAAFAVAAAQGEIRVCLDTSHVIAPRIHGTAVYATELVQAIAAQEGVSLRVRVANALMRDHFESLGVSTVSTEGELTGDHVVHHPSQIYSRAQLGALLRAQGHLVLTWQDLIAYRSAGALGPWERTAEFRSLTWACMQSAQGVLAISNAAKDDLVRTFGREDVMVTPLGLNPAVVPAASRVAEVKAKHRAERPYVICVGSDFPHKNHAFLLQAWLSVQTQLGPNAPELLIVGPPSHTHHAFFSRAHHVSGMRLLGELPFEEVMALMAGAQALSFPSVYEGFGLPMLEAMASDVPVVALGLSAMSEVAGDAALLVADGSSDSFANALVRAVSDESVRRDLAKRGRARVKQYTWQKTAEHTVEAYRRVLQAPPLASLQARDALRRLF